MTLAIGGTLNTNKQTHLISRVSKKNYKSFSQENIEEILKNITWVMALV